MLFRSRDIGQQANITVARSFNKEIWVTHGAYLARGQVGQQFKEDSQRLVNEAKIPVASPPANPRPPFENPKDVWEWIVVLGNDMQSVSLGLGSAATMLALVAIMRPRPVNQAPVVNVTMPQSQAPVYGWGPSGTEPRRRKKRKGKGASEKADLPPREPNFTLGPSFEEEKAMLDAHASQAEEALLMGLVDANVALRGAISAETDPAKAG